MRIAIVDDCENERNELCKKLSQSSFSRSYDIEICGYGNGTDFLNEALQNRFGLVFMDIYMEKENGIDAAQKLRKFDKDCLLVFTTTSTDHALEGFRVRALHYLVKPYSDEELDMLLDEISQKISVEEKYIEIPSASDSLRIKLCDILYAEHFKHCIHIHCTDKSEKSVRSTFAEFVCTMNMYAVLKMLASIPQQVIAEGISMYFSSTEIFCEISSSNISSSSSLYGFTR